MLRSVLFTAPRLLFRIASIRPRKQLTTMNTVLSQPAPDTIQVLQHQQYQTKDHLTPATASQCPLAQFRTWFTEAAEQKVNEPEAVTLATATAQGVPSARVVLLKQVDHTGFVIYTNYTSRKSKELSENPNASLAFYWREMSRSVRVVGRAEKVTKAESEAYFKSRPVGSRLGAWASKQSSVIQEGDLEARLKKYQEKFGVKEGDTDGDVPAPDFWGGWRIVPTEIEFWSGKPSRLHDRVRYLRTNTEDMSSEPVWQVDKLSP